MTIIRSFFLFFEVFNFGILPLATAPVWMRLLTECMFKNPLFYQTRHRWHLYQINWSYFG